MLINKRILTVARAPRLALLRPSSSSVILVANACRYPRASFSSLTLRDKHSRLVLHLLISPLDDSRVEQIISVWFRLQSSSTGIWLNFESVPYRKGLFLTIEWFRWSGLPSGWRSLSYLPVLSCLRPAVCYYSSASQTRTSSTQTRNETRNVALMNY